jgi:hypothetical protein
MAFAKVTEPPCEAQGERWPGDIETHVRFHPSHRWLCRSVLTLEWCWVLEMWQTTYRRWRATYRRWREGFYSLCRLFVGVFFRMRRWRLNFEVEIKSFPLYTLFGWVSSAKGERVESRVPRISWYLVGFRVRWCDFRSTSSNLPISSLTIVAALIYYSFEP